MMQPTHAPTNIFLFNPRNAGFLDDTRRRLYSHRTAFLLALGFWGCIALGFGGLILYVGQIGLQNQALLDSDGVNVQATVLSKTTTVRSTNKKGEVTSLNYHITYQFRTSDSQLMTLNAQVSEAAYQQYENGSPLGVRYLPSNPRINRIEGEVDITPQMMVFGGVAFVIGLILMGIIVGYWMRSRRLERDGQIIWGRVVESKRKKNPRGPYYLEITYKFTSPEGTELQKTETSFHAAQINAQPYWKTVAVLYVNDRLYRAL